MINNSKRLIGREKALNIFFNEEEAGDFSEVEEDGLESNSDEDSEIDGSENDYATLEPVLLSPSILDQNQSINLFSTAMAIEQALTYSIQDNNDEETGLGVQIDLHEDYSMPLTRSVTFDVIPPPQQTPNVAQILKKKRRPSTKKKASIN